MEIGNIIPHIEALIFASDKPLTSMEITELINNAFGFMEEKLTLEQIQTSIDGIIEKYASEFYPFEVRESGGGWQFLTKKDFHKTVAQLNGEKFLKRLSSAALETLAIIAYKQPITKGEIEAIRGVSSDYSIQKLLEKELIIISGRNEEMPGKPLVYATSKTFMDYFGINSAADLPKLKEVFAETLVEPTLINHTPAEVILTPEGEVPLVVTETGELLVAASGTTGEDTATESQESAAEEVGDTAAEESDETADTDAASIGNDLETGSDLSESSSESEPSSESDEEGDVDDATPHDPASDESDEDSGKSGSGEDSGKDGSGEDSGEDDYGDDSGEQPPHERNPDTSDEH
ncbi:MAG TPA: SMC-Scp complex subunit ScpB [Puia sp.]|nr:SMC-Scp complex subunit ScpB [Puia sp.]